MIISVGYRVKSHVATRFRIWATQHLREFIVKGFVLDMEPLSRTLEGCFTFDAVRATTQIAQIVFESAPDSTGQQNFCLTQPINLSNFAAFTVW